MRIKSTLMSILLLAGWYTLTSTLKNPNDPPVARTGAPGETTCGASGCHSGGTYTGSVSITGITDTILADNTYSIILTNSSDAIRAGFQLTCLDANNTKCGTFTNGTGTSIGTSNSLGGRQYIRQTTPKTLSSNKASWTFTWKSPATIPGNKATFYFVSLAANGNGAKSGDNVLISKQDAILPAVISAATEPPANMVKVYPTQVSNVLFVELLEQGAATLTIYGLDSTIAMQQQLSLSSNAIPVESLRAGTYIAQIEKDGKIFTTRFIKVK